VIIFSQTAAKMKENNICKRKISTLLSTIISCKNRIQNVKNTHVGAIKYLLDPLNIIIPINKDVADN
jgi:hypothetical protein